MMICNICGYKVAFQPDTRKWICNGCGAFDPPIQIQPYRPERRMEIISIDENIMVRESKPEDFFSVAKKSLKRSEETIRKQEQDESPKREKDKLDLFRS